MANIKVRARVNVMNDGKTYPVGTEFEMAEEIVPVHVQAGQVDRVEETKQQSTPKNKQFDGGSKK